jgi:hypothetical protein
VTVLENKQLISTELIFHFLFLIGPVKNKKKGKLSSIFYKIAVYYLLLNLGQKNQGNRIFLFISFNIGCQLFYSVTCDLLDYCVF